MRINSIEWLKCPHCDILWNDARSYSADLLLSASSAQYGIIHTCSNCKKNVLVFCDKKVVFRTEEPDEKVDYS